LLCYVFSTKLEIRAEQVLPGKERGWEGECGAGGREKNDPNNVCTCELINKKCK
jgi:hypothetical protein